MQKRNSLLSFLLTAVLLILTILPAAAQPVQAASLLPKKLELIYLPGEPSHIEVVNAWEFPDNLSLKHAKCKSSNKKVVTIERSSDAGGQVAVDYISINGPGKATLTVVGKKGNGSYKTWKIKVIVTKYKNPLKRFKIGSKNYKNKFNEKILVGTMSKKTITGKLSIEAAKGYKITKIKTTYPVTKDGTRSYVTKKLADGKNVKLTWTGEMEITVKDLKTKRVQTLTLENGYVY